MNKSVILSCVFLATMLAGCTPYKTLTPAGGAIKIVDSKPAGCEPLGDIDSAGPFTKDESFNWIRNRAAEEGADTMRIDRVTNYSYGGMIVIGSNDYWAHKAYIYKCEK